jgi:predicted nucleotidyltransferase
VDLSDPTRAVTPTLDGPVLAVLATSARPLTVGEVAAQAVRGSEIGVRRCLGRLVEQGLVRATEVGRNRVHELNRDHIAAAIAMQLADLRPSLWARLRETVGKWKVKPLYACAFGSAARGDGGPDSDIDVLLVHAGFPGERRSGSLRTLDGLLGAAVDVLTVPVVTQGEASRWRTQVDRLHEQVRAWTGNPLQALDVSAYEWAEGRRRQVALYQEIERDAIVLYRPASLATLASKAAGAR